MVGRLSWKGDARSERLNNWAVCEAAALSSRGNASRLLILAMSSHIPLELRIHVVSVPVGAPTRDWTGQRRRIAARGDPDRPLSGKTMGR